MNSIPWEDPERRICFDAWFAAQAAAHGLNASTLKLASADASFRRYLRVHDRQGQSRIIMDAPPDKEPLAAFLHIDQLLQQAGLPVPEVLAADVPNGFLLMNDLGRQTALQYLLATAQDAPNGGEDTARRAQPLMVQALDWLIAMQTRVPAQSVPAYDADKLHQELRLFEQWYLGQHRRAELSASQTQCLHQSFELIVARSLAVPQVFVHRDYMLRNLMVQPDAAGQGARLSGLLDFQDALHGPITYDLASLLRDAFHSWEEDFVLDIAVRYWERARKAGLLANAPELERDFGEFYRAVEWMGLQRHLKVAGIFARLTLRDGKPQYLADAPRFIHYIRSTASRYRELRPLLRLIDEVEQTPQSEAFSFGRM
ncbi:aminoglycoside phosphotransferase [Allofranklinella schreckenbergeri]|uniref:Aminoglycoside phosphotransferase n=1 Tax=Allofranklinella schreckenbergeri TaxID=1076744 RepID=A0A3M6QGB9_9BURK|nr:phosphotransferase [Allofranklinella schreckenbergeri]RMX02144.1 aminoglycoside phosphotransferase [Allofranklinella schreckenbergeri]